MKDITEQITGVLARPGIFVTIHLPDPSKKEPKLVSPIVLQQGDSVQWLYEERFSLRLTGDVFDQTSLCSFPQKDGLFLAGPAMVTGSPCCYGTCTYMLERDPSGPDDPINPPPPPNDIIVDSSTPGSLDQLHFELIKRVKAIETDYDKRELLIRVIEDVLKAFSGNSQPETENCNGRTRK